MFGPQLIDRKWRNAEHTFRGGETMTARRNIYLTAGLFGLALIVAGCAATDANVRSPSQGQAAVQGDTAAGRSQATSESQDEKNKKRPSSTNPGY